MNLEDHLGDIVSKARAMSGVSATAAARAAGIAERELAVMEETGAAQGAPDYGKLGAVLGLDGAKLRRIAQGWNPEAKDLSAWRELRCITTDQGMAVNCYLAWDEATREAALFDTGWTVGPILDILSAEKLELRRIFITHSHTDHIACLKEIRTAFPGAHVHSGSEGKRLQHPDGSGEFIPLGSLRITRRDTPGHAEDGVTYVIENWPEEAPLVAIVGDTIFAGSMGKGNISWDLARRKIRDEILTLPPDTLLCPGHGPLTTVAEETEHNPFF